MVCSSPLVFVAEILLKVDFGSLKTAGSGPLCIPQEITCVGIFHQGWQLEAAGHRVGTEAETGSASSWEEHRPWAEIDLASTPWSSAV